MWHFPATGVAGLDLYAWDEGNATWRWLSTTHTNLNKGAGGCVNALTAFPACSGDACTTVRYRLHLPLYNGVADLRIGFDSDHGASSLQQDTSAAAAATAAKAPVVWYGTSIAQGGVASRPGMAFTNIISRNLDRE